MPARLPSREEGPTRLLRSPPPISRTARRRRAEVVHSELAAAVGRRKTLTRSQRKGQAPAIGRRARRPVRVLRTPVLEGTFAQDVGVRGKTLVVQGVVVAVRVRRALVAVRGVRKRARERPALVVAQDEDPLGVGVDRCRALELMGLDQLEPSERAGERGRCRRRCRRSSGVAPGPSGLAPRPGEHRRRRRDRFDDRRRRRYWEWRQARYRRLSLDPGSGSGSGSEPELARGLGLGQVLELGPVPDQGLAPDPDLDPDPDLERRAPCTS